ncbi:MAG: hypothetical protein AMXMBFR34_28480 [Myxococcaceae bacterium]
MPRKPKDAYQHALSLLGRRERTTQELRAALLAKGHPEAEVEPAIARVQALGYLDDARVAQARARRQLPEGRSRADVTRRLVAHGVSEDVARRATEEAARDVDHHDEASARAFIARRRVTGLKAARLLASRGYEEALIRRVTGLGEGDD